MAFALPFFTTLLEDSHDCLLIPPLLSSSTIVTNTFGRQKTHGDGFDDLRQDRNPHAQIDGVHCVEEETYLGRCRKTVHS